jgi:signal transduction histidine kinase
MLNWHMKQKTDILSMLLSPRGAILAANVVLLIGLSILATVAYLSLSEDALSKARDEAFRTVEVHGQLSEADHCAVLRNEAAKFAVDANDTSFVLGPDQQQVAVVSPAPEADPNTLPSEHSLNGKKVMGAWWVGEGCGSYFSGVYIEPFQGYVWKSLRFVIWVGLAAVIANFAMGLIAQRLLKRDLLKVLEDCKKIEEGDLDHKVQSDLNSAELSSIASQINTMTGSIRLLVLNLRTISVTITHDLRNYINHARIRLRNAEKGLDSSSRSEVLVALSSLQRLDALATEISRLSVNPGGSLSVSVTQLDAVAKRTLALFKDSFEDAGMAVETDLQATASRVSEPLLTEVIANLLGNSIKYGADGNRILIRTFSEGGKSNIEVSDFGQGVPEKDRESIFRLDSRLADNEQTDGNGFGLAIAKLFTVMNNGEITVRSTQEHANLPGATFRLTFPAFDQTSKV